VLTAEAATAPPLLAVLAPFLLSIVFLALSPLLTLFGKQKVRGQILRDSAAAGQPIVNGEFPLTEANRDGTTSVRQIAVPAAVDPASIDDYVDYVIDLVGFVPTTLLPVAGAIFALFSDITQSTAVIVLLISIVVAIGGLLWIATRSAQDYASRKGLRLSVASWMGIVANLISIVLIAWAS
jgi:hypothetical protein